MFWRPPLKRFRKPWWDTDFGREWQVSGLLAQMWGGLFAYIPPMPADNNRDHCRW